MVAFSDNTMPLMALDGVPYALVVTDPAIEDNPIVFVNTAFTKLTGYTADDAVGRNCRFLQGANTDPADAAALREGLATGGEFTVELLNYKADGTPFLNRLYIAPLRRPETGEIAHYIGMQRPVGISTVADPIVDGADMVLREVHHRVKNHLSMVVGMIRMQARAVNASSLENYSTLARRIETLQLLYQEMTAGSVRYSENQDLALGAYVSRIASTVAYLDGRSSIRLNVDTDDLRAPIDTAAQIGLLASELLTNAYQHAFKDGRPGLVDVRLQGLRDGAIRLEVADDGAGMPHDATWPDGGNLGGKIVRSLLAGLGATISVGGGPNGTILAVDVPGHHTSKASAPTHAEPATVE